MLWIFVPDFCLEMEQRVVQTVDTVQYNWYDKPFLFNYSLLYMIWVLDLHVHYTICDFEASTSILQISCIDLISFRLLWVLTAPVDLLTSSSFILYYHLDPN